MLNDSPLLLGIFVQIEKIFMHFESLLNLLHLAALILLLLLLLLS